jgi:hypothetical protein
MMGRYGLAIFLVEELSFHSGYRPQRTNSSVSSKPARGSPQITPRMGMVEPSYYIIEP